MLTIRSLVVAYEKNEVLHSVDLDLASGEVLGLIGPNGSGKTSLIRAISSVVKIKQGNIQIDDRDLSTLSENERARLISVVPQSAQLPPAFTVWECVSLGRTPHLNWLGKLGWKDDSKIKLALEACEILDFKERRAGELSGGEQQRVLLARALAQDCPILLMDEPTAHLDLHHQVALLSLARRMAKEQKLAVLVAMHDLNLAALYSDRLALLVDGQIRAVGTPAQVLTNEVLQSAYHVPLHVHPHPQHDVPWIVLPRE